MLGKQRKLESTIKYKEGRKKKLRIEIKNVQFYFYVKWINNLLLNT